MGDPAVRASQAVVARSTRAAHRCPVDDLPIPHPVGIALPVPVRTDECMPSHGLDTGLRTQHAVTAIRGPRYPAPDTITARRGRP